MENEWTSERKPSPKDRPELDAETLAAVRALQGGEVHESTRHLFETFEPELGAYFRRHGCQDDEADDLTQTVFMQMLERIGTLKDAPKFHVWLFRIARNYLRNFLRDRARSREGFEEFADKARKDSEKDDEAEEKIERVVDSPAAIAAVRRADRARGRSRRRVTRTILPAGNPEQEPALGRLGKDDLGFPAILLEEAAAFLGDGVDGKLALKAKLTCAGALLARGRRFKVARRVEDLVRHALVLAGNGHCGSGWRDEIRHKVAEGSTLLRSFLDHHQHDSSRRLETCQRS